MSTLRFALLVAEKDLRAEGRAQRTIVQVVVLGLLIVIVLALGLGPDAAQRTGAGATAILWVAFIFGGSLCFEKTLDVECRDDALAALLMSPAGRGGIYFGKLLTNLAMMLVLGAVVTPASVLFLNFDFSGAPIAFIAILTLGLVGFTAVGTLFSTLSACSRLSRGLFSLLVLPVILPLVITSNRLMSRALDSGESAIGGIGILIAFDIIFLTASWLVFELALENEGGS